jgi:DNA-binding FadR family transcriptional regulator
LTSGRSLPERDAVDLEEHWAIVAALSYRDEANAEKAMHDHVIAAGRHFTTALRALETVEGEALQEGDRVEF